MISNYFSLKSTFFADDKKIDPAIQSDTGPVSTPQKITREEIKKFDENTKSLSELREIVEKSKQQNK